MSLTEPRRAQRIWLYRAKFKWWLCLHASATSESRRKQNTYSWVIRKTKVSPPLAWMRLAFYSKKNEIARRWASSIRKLSLSLIPVSISREIKSLPHFQQATQTDNSYASSTSSQGACRCVSAFTQRTLTALLTRSPLLKPPGTTGPQRAHPWTLCNPLLSFRLE